MKGSIKLSFIIEKPIAGEWGEDDERGNGIPVIRTTNFTNDGTINFGNIVTRKINKNNIENKFLKDGDIIIEKSGGSEKQPVGRVVFFYNGKSRYLFNNFTAVLRVKDTVLWLPRYIFYSLFYSYKKGNSKRFENRTTGLHNLQLDKYVESIYIRARAYSEQEKIVTILDKAKTIIELRKAQLEKLESCVNARFVEMFGDPVTNTKYLALKDLKDVLVLKAGDFTAASDISNEITETHRYPCYGGNGIRGYVSEYNQEGEYSLIGRQGALSGNIQFAKGRFKNTEHALLVMPIIEMNSIWLNQVLINMELKRYQSGAAQPGLSVKNLQEVKIIIVPMEEQNAFADFVNQVDKSKVS